MPDSTSELLDSASKFLWPGDVVEVRIPKAGKDGTVSGYFDDPAKLADAVSAWRGTAAGIYLTLNPVCPALLARAANRLKTRADTTTADSDVVRRRWLPLDFDPVRASGISSTNEEHRAALDRARAVSDWLLKERGWPAPILASSGNGAHLVFRIDLPNDEDSTRLVERVLRAVAGRFSDSAVDVDVKVGNAARIWKLYGTVARKGDPTADRPHRTAILLALPVRRAAVSREQLEAVAALHVEPAPAERPRRSRSDFSIDDWVAAHLPGVARGPEPWKGGRKWILRPCPFGTEHGEDDGTCLVQLPSGAIGFTCHHAHCAGKRWEDLRRLLEPGREPGGGDGSRNRNSDGDDGRPTIRIVESDRPGMVDQAEDALLADVAAGGDRIFVRGGALVRLVRSTTVVRTSFRSGGEVTRPAGHLASHLVTRPSILERFERVARWTRYDGRARRDVPKDCPEKVAEFYLARAGSWRMPSLDAIVEAPFMRPDGSVVQQPGYDEATGVLLDPGGWTFPPVPDEPTEGEAREALAEVKDVLAEFPFVNPSARAAALAEVVTPVARPAFPQVPIFVNTAPKAGTGKGLVVHVASIVATGRPAPAMTLCRDDDELKKKIFALLLEASPIVLLDNVDRPLGGETLDSAITEPVFKDRILGVSGNAAVTTQGTTWYASGNNVTVRGDLLRRTVWCDIDARMERPETRTFRRPDLLGFVAENRGRLVRAALTVLRAYVVAGRPDTGVNPLGNFEAWSRLVREALIWLDEGDPCGGRDFHVDSDPVEENLRTLLAEWQRAIGQVGISAGALIQKAESDHGLKEAILAVAGRGGRMDSRELGYFLRRHVHRISDGRLIIRAGASKGSVLWTVTTDERGR